MLLRYEQTNTTTLSRIPTPWGFAGLPEQYTVCFQSNILYAPTLAHPDEPYKQKVCMGDSGKHRVPRPRTLINGKCGFS